MNNANRTLKTLAAAATVALLAASTGSAFAAGTWQQNHPRRVEVNSRLANQNARIHNEVRNGEMSHAQARSLHQEDRTIRAEERGMASQNGGHLTRLDKRALNQEENGVSRQIGH